VVQSSKVPGPISVADVSKMCAQLIEDAEADPFAQVFSVLLRARAVLFRRGLREVARVRAIRALLVEGVDTIDRFFPPSRLAAASVGGGR